MIRAKCDLRTCFDKRLREWIRVNSGATGRWTAKTHSVETEEENHEEREREREFNPDNSDTSACKTNSIGNQ